MITLKGLAREQDAPRFKVGDTVKHVGFQCLEKDKGLVVDDKGTVNKHLVIEVHWNDGGISFYTFDTKLIEKVEETPKEKGIEEEFQEAFKNWKYATFDSTKEMCREFFGAGRESARVFVKVEGGVAETMVSEGVRVALLDYDKNFFVYEKEGKTHYTTNWSDIPEAESEDDTVDLMDDGDRLERVPEAFRNLKNVQGERY